jgi:hypothetical protein
MTGRFGGAAVVGRIIKDDYGYGPEPKKRISGSTVATVGGLGVAGLGVRQMTDSRNIEDITASRRAGAEMRQRTAEREESDARKKKADFERQRANRSYPIRRLNPKNRRARALEGQVDLASTKAHNARGLVGMHNDLSTPEKIANRGKNMKRVGAAMAVGGTLVAARNYIPGIRPKPSPVYVTKEDVIKTITQSRYGGNAEAGRAWPGKEKREHPRSGDAAVGLGGVALASGAVGAGGLGRTAKKKVADPTTRHAHEAQQQDLNIRAQRPVVNQAGRRVRLVNEAIADQNLPRVQAQRAKIGLAPKDFPLRQSKRTGEIHAGRMVGRLGAEAKQAGEDVKGLVMGRQNMRARHVEEKASHLKDIKGRALGARTAKIALPVAGVAGVGALLAGRKAEQGRSKGRTVRERPLVKKETPAPAPEPKKDWRENFSANERKGFERTMQRSNG